MGKLNINLDIVKPSTKNPARETLAFWCGVMFGILLAGMVAVLAAALTRWMQ